jgi:tRNA 2-selenouridine synthase
MAVERINIDRFLELANTYPVLDVRSPGEYLHAHIPGAISFPLFTDEERKVVGTTYKQQSREQAIKVGLDFFAPKMRKMVEKAEAVCGVQLTINSQQSTNNSKVLSNTASQSEIVNPKSKILLIHCWRGGMRSAAIAWLLDLYGFKVYTLAGGYKCFRKHVLETFTLPFSLKILGGYTGSAKTSLLKTLFQKGEAVIDLEAIANHKGSAFGNIDMEPQPGQEMFENLLAKKLREILKDDPAVVGHKDIWIEDESQRIGLVNIPGDLWK